MLFGARIFKTGLAVTLSMFICNYFNIQPAIFAGAATVLNMQPSLGLSFKNALEQILVSVVAIILAIALGLILGNNVLIMGLATILVIFICQRFKWRGALSGGVMASIFILSSPAEQFIDHALMRSIAIFIGVAVALIVNHTIAPPRYHQPLQKKLLELNTMIKDRFHEAVLAFLYLDIPSPEEQKEKQTQIEQLFRETQKLHELYVYDIGPRSPEQAESDTPGNLSKFYDDYITYNKGMWQRARDVLFLAQERRERRKERGDLPISPEFQAILDLLAETLDIFLKQNEALQHKLEGQEAASVEEMHIWSKLDKILNTWHNQFPSGSYHLHALVEVSLITYKIRWGVKESARLLS
ncbi:MAG: aromatic acid exporter family protein [Clostridia bacterium]|jgi:uncharacterized membrane protein YgaE (UPF0421/DUF939 family)|nr:aromatic acid exporter family protein [Clostridia bacterium]